MKTITDQLQMMSVYVPPTVARTAVYNPHQQPGGTWRRFYAATAFADISGFTPLAEALAKHGVRGAEELTAVLNEVFEALITTAESHGGQVVKFGGDALSLIWPCEPEYLTESLWRAIKAAFAMQKRMSEFSTVSAGEGVFELRMKMGLSAGQLLEVHAGGVFGRWEYVLAGSPMANMAHAENHAQAGEIVVDAHAWQLMEGIESDQVENGDTESENQSEAPYVLGEAIADGFYRLNKVSRGLPARALIAPDWSRLDETTAAKVAAVLRGYIPGAISSILESGHKSMLAELKLMTVCFLGFDGIDYDNDLDAGPRLVHFMRDAQEMIYHYEGSVNKLSVGDKGSLLLALFGAPPFFHEDDEVRGVACALALLKVAARHHLQVRIGLAAGTVFAGPLGAPQRQEYTVISDSVNLAARLMQKANPGQVWVDASVQSQADRYFEYQDQGIIQVKGKSESRHVYIALGEKEQDQEELVMGYLLSNQELTGRENELEVVDHIADKVWDGHGQVLLLRGEAGVGKSRLVAEIVRRWMMRGGVSHGGDCVSYGQQTPYLPWRGILSSMAGLSPRLSVNERLARLERTLLRLPAPTSQIHSDSEALSTSDYWQQRLPLLAEILGLAAEDTNLTRNLAEDLRRDNLFATIRAIILEEARTRPTLIVLEDIHWSDELSFELVADLASQIAQYPALLILAYRPLSQPYPLPYQRLRALPYTASMLVDELGPEAGLKLVKNKLGVKEIPPEVADLISKKGQGNPFFIEELVNSLLSMGVIKVEDGICLVEGDLNNLELPDTVQKIVLARIDRLPEPEKVTLKVAAAIGRTFQRDLLEAIHPWFNDGRSLSEQLARLQAEDFTRQEVSESDLDFLFKHVITQEVAYETMLYSQRRQLHATIGTVLEKRYLSNDSEIVDLLAYHYARSNEPHKALYYLQRAGQKALNGYANEAAITYYTDALKMADELDMADVMYELLADRERAYSCLGNRTAQAEDLSQMEKLATSQGNIIQQLDVGNRRLQLATDLGKYEEAIEIAENVHALAQRSKHNAWQARTLTNMGIAYWRHGSYNKALEALENSLKFERTLKDEQLKATNFNYLGLIYNRISDYQQSQQAYQKAMKIYQTIGDRGGEAGCANNLGLFEASLGRYEQAKTYYSRALSICLNIGDKPREGISLNTLGQVLTILGQYEEAEEYLDRSLVIRRNVGDLRGEAFCLHDMGYLYLAQGQSSKAIEDFEVASQLRQKLGETGNYIASLAALGEAHLMAGNLDQAHNYLLEAVENLRSGKGNGEYPSQNVWWIYSRVCQANGEKAEAKDALIQAYNLIQRKAQQIDDPTLKQSYLTQIKVNHAVLKAVEEQKLKI